MLFRVSVSSDWCLPLEFFFRDFRVHHEECKECTNIKKKDRMAGKLPFCRK